ncbi:MAG: DUF21 domain-containing protein [Gammaproteobacteria bacterium]|nr:DUF21 domain-containing protein [Gammaproteobacteria bacterium]
MISLFFLILCSLFISLFFSASEAALLRLNRYKIQAQKPSLLNKILIHLLNRLDEVLICILLGNTFANIVSASALSSYLTHHDASPEVIGIASAILTVLILLVAEVFPKTIATFNPDKSARYVAYPLRILLWVLRPVVLIIRYLNIWFLKRMGIEKTHPEHQISFREYKFMISESLKHERTSYYDMMMNVLELHELTVNDVMVMPPKMVVLNIEAPLEDIVQLLISSPHQWLPVIEGSMDCIVGLLKVQDCLSDLLMQTLDRDVLRTVMTTPYYIPEKTPLSVQYRHFQRETRRIALVVDEYGELLGLISMQDILDQLIGTDVAILESEISQEIPNEWIIPGELHLSAFRRITGVEIESEHASTIGGVLIERLESVPEAGTSITIDGTTYEILQSSNQRILKVRATLRIDDAPLTTD